MKTLQLSRGLARVTTGENRRGKPAAEQPCDDDPVFTWLADYRVGVWNPAKVVEEWFQVFDYRLVRDAV